MHYIILYKIIVQANETKTTITTLKPQCSASVQTEITSYKQCIKSLAASCDEQLKAMVYKLEMEGKNKRKEYQTIYWKKQKNCSLLIAGTWDKKVAKTAQ